MATKEEGTTMSTLLEQLKAGFVHVRARADRNGVPGLPGEVGGPASPTVLMEAAIAGTMFYAVEREGRLGRRIVEITELDTTVVLKLEDPPPKKKPADWHPSFYWVRLAPR